MLCIYKIILALCVANRFTAAMPLIPVPTTNTVFPDNPISLSTSVPPFAALS